MAPLTLHHLQRGQSERIIWLLEELNLPYELVLYQRQPLLAPPSLKAQHKLGTAPVLKDGDVSMSETMAVATYILDIYGSKSDLRLTVSPSEPGYTDYIFILYFVLNSLQPAGTNVMLAYFDKSLSDDSPAREFPRGRFLKYLNFTEEWLADGDKQFLAGDKFTLADIMALWVFTTSRTFIPYSLKPYPHIYAYVQRLVEREAYKKAMDKGDHGLPILSGEEPGDAKAYF